ncbi:hypothetical protein E3E23_04410 [Thermococcus sp. CX2]|uniref:hypothetical protein n=1 Tax=Thermococcus sp. CX2 TaxID=163006 RepID=UPI00143ADF95|nr:hypothetical protein [Thermococcus sp. CX2]NJE85073.1 hypothetical protein [Thermococcus sp. CX2]
MRPKTVVFSFFLILSAYFYGLAAISVGEKYTFWGFMIIATIHLAFSYGIKKGHELIVDVSPHIALLDFLFGLLWVLIGLSVPAVSLTLLSALALFILLDEEVRMELKS